MNTIRNTGLALTIAGAGLVGCATTLPPQDLANARTAYHRASTGPAAQLDPAGLHSAKVQLDAAEASFAEDGDTRGTRDQAYLALRKTQLAEVVASKMLSDQRRNSVVDEMHADEKNAVARTSADLARTKSELAAQGVALDAQGMALQNEKSRREDAEMRAAEAAAALANFAQVKQEPRGMVITLSGSILFASGKWALLPAAQVKLNEVANALAKEDSKAKIVVEGHTDSKGSASDNQELSRKRAQSVRDYLVTRGIASDRISAQGFGQTRSIADNKTAEGRANNRRVEIVVLPKTTSG